METSVFSEDLKIQKKSKKLLGYALLCLFFAFLMFSVSFFFDQIKYFDSFLILQILNIVAAFIISLCILHKIFGQAFGFKIFALSFVNMLIPPVLYLEVFIFSVLLVYIFTLFLPLAGNKDASMLFFSLLALFQTFIFYILTKAAVSLNFYFIHSRKRKKLRLQEDIIKENFALFYILIAESIAIFAQIKF